MARTLFARGSRGWLVGRIQSALADHKLYTARIDNDFGALTEGAVMSFQKARNAPATGRVDEITWTALLNEPLLTLFQRCLQLTSYFEGHGFTRAAGNWDGAGLTWGIIGFTLKFGKVQKILLEAVQREPAAVRAALVGLNDDLLRILGVPLNDQMAWADSISESPKKHLLREPWRSAFVRLGELPLVRKIQLSLAYDDYFVPALATARRYNLSSEQGVALCFDIHVQNGGIEKQDAAAIAAGLPSLPPGDEQALRVLIANSVADHAKLEFREDTRSRKLAIAAARAPFAALASPSTPGASANSPPPSLDFSFLLLPVFFRASFSTLA